MENRKDYRVIVYDGVFQDYLWETEEFFETEEQAIENAMEYYEFIDTYNDEVQLYVRGLGIGEWCMFGYLIEYENGKPCLEECFY